MAFKSFIKTVFEPNRYFFAIFAIITAVVFVVYRMLLLNITTHLFDWNDYPLLVWILDQHIDHFRSGQWGQIFQSNIFYPFTDTLLFSELLLPTSAIGLVLSFFTPNRLLVQNILFFLAFYLNGLAAIHLWKRFFTKWVFVAVTLFTVFSPFVILNVGHFQLLHLWPFLFGFSFLLSKDWSLKNATTVGFWIALTFVSSVYLSIFLMFAAGVWFFTHFLFIWKDKKALFTTTRWFIVLMLASVLLISPFAYRYFEMRNRYEAKRPYHEYVTYALSPFDYLSSGNYRSVVSSLPPIRWWNVRVPTKSAGHFPGFILSFLAISSFVTVVAVKKERRVGFTLPVSIETVYFFLLGLAGFVFSWGPRLKLTNTDVGMLLPYSIFLKTIPLFEPIRATGRWSFLFFLALAFFAGYGLQNVILPRLKARKQTLFIGLCVVIFFLEVLPISQKTEARSYFEGSFPVLQEACKESAVLLEYPITYNPTGDIRGIIPMLQHWSSIVYIASEHNCRSINGYSGLFPPDYTRFESAITTAFNQGSVASVSALLSERGVQLFKVDADLLTATEASTLRSLLEVQQGEELLYQSDADLLIRLK
jgi:hypothetical protein